MSETEQAVMCALLQTLLDKAVITQDIYGKAREKVLGTADWPEFFCGEEVLDGNA